MFKDDTKFAQRLYVASGLYLQPDGKTPRPLDGIHGSGTSKAEADFDAACDRIAAKYGVFDARSESNIRTLVLPAQMAARMMLFDLNAAGKKAGLVYKVLSGTRDYAEQTALYNQGRTTKGNIVTNAKAGYSNHNFGIAWDIGIFKGGLYYTGGKLKPTATEPNPPTPTTQEAAYVAAAKLALAKQKLDWGGNWKNSTDLPHYGLLTGRSMTQVRTAFEAGKPYF